MLPPPAPEQAEAESAMHKAPAAKEAVRILERIRNSFVTKGSETNPGRMLLPADWTGDGVRRCFGSNRFFAHLSGPSTLICHVTLVIYTRLSKIQFSNDAKPEGVTS